MDDQEQQIAEWLYEGVMALLSGDKETATELLMQVVNADSRNEAGWLWLSGAVDDPDDQEIALKNVLDLNPDSEPAQMGLAWIGRS